MGMYGLLEQISSENLSELIENLHLVHSHILVSMSQHFRHDMSEGVSKPGPQLVRDKKKTLSEEPRKIFSLEKDWHILHYILNGTAEGGTGPLANVVLGGAEIHDQEGNMGYRPAHYLTAQQVKAVAQALGAVDFAKLAKAFDPKDAAAKGIYGLTHPGGFVSVSAEELAGFVEPVRVFYADAAENGNAMLFYIT
jgi:hypothetical protein